MNRERPLTTSIAAIILALLSAAGLAAPLLLGGGVPAAVYVSVASGAAGLLAVYGLWTLRRWGTVLAVVVAALGIVSAAPGLAFAPTPGLLAQAILGVAGSAIVVVFALLPASRRAYA